MSQEESEKRCFEMLDAILTVEFKDMLYSTKAKGILKGFEISLYRLLPDFDATKRAIYRSLFRSQLRLEKMIHDNEPFMKKG